MSQANLNNPLSQEPVNTGAERLGQPGPKGRTFGKPEVSSLFLGVCFPILTHETKKAAEKPGGAMQTTTPVQCAMCVEHCPF